MDERIIKNKTKKKILIILITTALLITSFSTVTGNTTTSMNPKNIIQIQNTIFILTMMKTT